MSQDILSQAYKYCIAKGFRFTPPRARVLKVLVDESRPMGAYDILQKLSDEMGKHNPPTIYRAIQFWHQEGFIHCIDSLKSYVACSHGMHIGQSQFLICNHCDYIKELDNTLEFSAISDAATSHKFKANSFTIEIKGLCADCNTVSL